MSAGVITPAGHAVEAVEPHAPVWPVARALARAEIRRLVRSPAVIVSFAFTAAFLAPFSFWPEVPDLRRHAAESPFNAYLLAAGTLIATNLAALRSKRHGTEELFRSTPGDPQARTVAHVLSGVAPAIVMTVLISSVIVVLWVTKDPLGRADGADLAVGPLLVFGAGALGVLLARWVRSPLAGPVACVAIAAVELYTDNRELTSPLGRLGFRIGAGELPPEILPGRLSRWHLVYLIGLILLAVVGALLAHGLRRRLVVAGVVALSLVATATWFQTRPATDGDWAARNALLTHPQDHQVCEDRSGVRYCAYPAYRPLIDRWQRPVEGVRRAVPDAAWPAGLEVSQRVARNDRQYITGARLEQLAEVLPAIVERPRDGGSLHPPVTWDTTGRAELGLALLAAARAVQLPLTPSEPDLRCDATGQGRAVVALWLAGQASPTTRSTLLRLSREALLNVDGRPVMVMPDFGTTGAVAWGALEVGHALELLDRPVDDVATAISRAWPRLTDKATPTHVLAGELGLSASESAARTGAPRSGFAGFGAIDAGPVPQLAGACP